MNYFVSTFYYFVNIPISDLENLRCSIEACANENQIQGLLILGGEGFNTTVSCTNETGLLNFKNFIRNKFNCLDLFFKDSISDIAPFRMFKIKIRPEIVTLGTPELVPNSSVNHHLSPSQWNDVLKNEKDFLLVDTRNWYETKIGTFKGAINPCIDKFTEFPDYIEKHNISKDKKILIFCTGGIRCEKGILELQRQGFDNVYQLNGGIINYMQEYPNDHFEGECFVFDHRVALDADLKPSKKYGLCPHCGQPSEIQIHCRRCDKEQLICTDCKEMDWKKETCSKDCAYQLKLHPERYSPE